MSVRSLADWLNLRDYDDAIHYARIAVIKRFARGNVSFQNGNVLDEEALDQLRAKGDRAMADLIEYARAKKSYQWPSLRTSKSF